MNEDLRLLGERIAEMAAHLDAATHRFLTDLREFDTKGGYYQAGAKTCAHWMSWRIGCGLGTAREHVRVAKALADLPLINEALKLGMTSYSKVRAMTRVATPKNERLLLSDALLMCGQQLEKVCQKYRMVQRHDRLESAEDAACRRYVRRRSLDDGMVRIEAVLHPDEAALLWAVLDRAAKDMANGVGPEDPQTAEETAGSQPRGEFSDRDVPAGTSVLLTAGDHDVPAGTSVLLTAGDRDVPAGTLDRRRPKFDRADALVNIAQRFACGKHQDCNPIEVVVTIPATALKEGAAPCVTNIGCLPDGDCIHGETGRRLSCDAGIVWMIEDDVGQAMSVGRRARAIPTAIKRALVKRDRTCRFPGCDNRLYVEGHHIEHWADGGETALSNLLLLCSQHHRFLHEYKYRIEFDPDHGEPVFFDAQGRRVHEVPPPIADARRGWDAIIAANQDLEITHETNEPGWDGQPIPYNDVVGYLSQVDNDHLAMDRYYDDTLKVLGRIGRPR